jgi:hypothetical protein
VAVEDIEESTEERPKAGDEGGTVPQEVSTGRVSGSWVGAVPLEGQGIAPGSGGRRPSPAGGRAVAQRWWKGLLELGVLLLVRPGCA